MKTGSRFFSTYRKKRNNGAEGRKAKKSVIIRKKERNKGGPGRRRVRVFGARAKRVAVVAHISGA